MIAALRYEWLRMTTLRSTWWLAGVAILVPAGLSLLIAIAVGPAEILSEGVLITQVVITQGAAVGFPLLVAYLASLFGVFCFGHEYRHGMIRATLTAVPRREHVLVAKTVMTVLFTAVVSALAMLLGLGFATALMPTGSTVSGSAVWGVVLGVVVYTTMFSLVGLALSAIFRNQVAALVFMFIVPSVAEQVTQLVLVMPDGLDSVQDAAKYVPFDAGSQLFNRASLNDTFLAAYGVTPLGAVSGAVVFAVFTGLMLSVASMLFLRRDV